MGYVGNAYTMHQVCNCLFANFIKYGLYTYFRKKKKKGREIYHFYMFEVQGGVDPQYGSGALPNGPYEMQQHHMVDPQYGHGVVPHQPQGALAYDMQQQHPPNNASHG